MHTSAGNVRFIRSRRASKVATAVRISQSCVAQPEFFILRDGVFDTAKRKICDDSECYRPLCTSFVASPEQ